MRFLLFMLICFCTLCEVQAQQESRTILAGRHRQVMVVTDSMFPAYWQAWEHIDTNEIRFLLTDAIWQDCDSGRTFYAYRNIVYSHELNDSTALPIRFTIDSGSIGLNYGETFLVPYPGDRNKLIVAAMYNDPTQIRPDWVHTIRVTAYDRQLGEFGRLWSVDLDEEVLAGIGIARHANQRDYWLIVAIQDSLHRAQMKSFLISPSGISQQPTNQIQFYHEEHFNPFAMQVAVSPQSNKLVLHNYGSYLSIVDFDNQNGQLTHKHGMNFFQYMPRRPGILTVSKGAFSPGGNHYYFLMRDYRRVPVQERYFQFDMNRADSVSFIAGLVSWRMSHLIDDFFSAPDGSTYFVQKNIFDNQIFLSRFKYPDRRGSDAEVQWGWQRLGISQGNQALYFKFSSVVPDFNRANRFGILGDSTLCRAETRSYILSETHRLDAVHWEYIHPESGQLVSDTQRSIQVQFSEKGLYTLTAWVDYCDTVMQLSKNILVKDVPAEMLADTFLCRGASLQMFAPDDSSTVLQWSDGSVGYFIDIDQPGWYWLERQNGCGSSRDSFYVEPFRLPETGLPKDTAICMGEAILLQANMGNYQIIWPDGDQSLIKRLYEPGTYLLVLEDDCGRYLDTLRVFGLESPAGGWLDTTTCRSVPYSFPDSTLVFTTLYWSDGSQALPRDFRSDYNGSVRLVNPCGEGVYELNVLSIDCACELFVPTAFTPNGDGLNEEFKVFSPCELPLFEMYIYNRWGQVIFHSNSINHGWDGHYQDEKLGPGIYSFSIYYQGQYSNAPQLRQGNFYLMQDF